MPNGKKTPTHLAVTACVAMMGPDVDEKTGRKIPIDAGTDCKMPYAKAMRLASLRPPRVAITDEDRAAARKRAKAAAKNGEKNGDEKTPGK